jgi:hypothetical protein
MSSLCWWWWWYQESIKPKCDDERLYHFGLSRTVVGILAILPKEEASVYKLS